MMDLWKALSYHYNPGLVTARRLDIARKHGITRLAATFDLMVITAGQRTMRAPGGDIG